MGFSLINHPFFGYHHFWKHIYTQNSGFKWVQSPIFPEVTIFRVQSGKSRGQRIDTGGLWIWNPE